MPAKTYKRKVNKRKTRKNKKHSKNKRGGIGADTTARYDECKGMGYASTEACNRQKDDDFQKEYAKDILEQRKKAGIPIRSVADRQREEVFRAKYPISSRLGLKTMTNPNEPYNSKRGYFW